MDNVNGIRIIDCKNICGKSYQELANTNEFKVFSEKFGSGLKENGIVYLINHEVESDVISNFKRKLTELYALPFDVKKSYDPASFGVEEYGSWGWKGPTTEKLMRDKYTVESFDFTSNPRFEDDKLYPKEISGLKEAVATFRKQGRSLNNKLLLSLGDYLGLPQKDYFLNQHRATEENYARSRFSVRTLFYPIEPEADKSAVPFRLHEHQDFGTMSQLCLDSQTDGMQVKLNNKIWSDVAIVPNSLVVVAGRALEMWTGGNIPAPFQRHKWTDRSKIQSQLTFGCFLGPDRDACTLPQVKENPNWTKQYVAMEAGEVYEDYFKREVALLERKYSA